MNKTKVSLINTPEFGDYISPYCKVVKFKIGGILCQSLPGDNIGGWESGNGGGEDLDSDW